MYHFEEIVLLFFIYSFIGWLWETVYDSLREKRFVYRGFLAGPYCPIYGFGILGVLYLLRPFHGNLLILYFSSAIIVSVLEYVTSYCMEKLFHTTWWDYKKVPFNLNGRIALPISLFWGVACVLIVNVVHPKVQQVVTFLIAHFGLVLPILIVVIMGTDLAYTLWNMRSFQKVLGEVSDKVEDGRAKFDFHKSVLKESVLEKGEELSSRLEEGKETLQERWQDWKESAFEDRDFTEKLPKLNLTQRRLLKNFPHYNPKDLPNAEDVKSILKRLSDKK